MVFFGFKKGVTWTMSNTTTMGELPMGAHFTLEGERLMRLPQLHMRDGGAFYEVNAFRLEERDDEERGDGLNRVCYVARNAMVEREPS